MHIYLRGPNGEREVKARDFYHAAYMTEREDDEVMVAVTFDAPKVVMLMKNRREKLVTMPLQPLQS